jgi:hypothetical protein
LRRFDLRLGGFSLLFGLIVLSLRRKSLAQQLALPTFCALRIRQHSLRRSQIGFRRTQRVSIILGFNSRNDLAGRNGIADCYSSLLEAAADPESQIDRILGLDLTCQTDCIAT